VDETGDIGVFLITSEGSAAAGIRRIEAVTGREAYNLIQKKMKEVKKIERLLNVRSETIVERIQSIQDELEEEKKENKKITQKKALSDFIQLSKSSVDDINGVSVCVVFVENADKDTQMLFKDNFYPTHPRGVLVSGSIVNGKPLVVSSSAPNLMNQEVHAGKLATEIGPFIGGSGGGTATLGQAGGRDPESLKPALEKIKDSIKQKLK
jgi:alanyl-tRNA synthetase